MLSGLAHIAGPVVRGMHRGKPWDAAVLMVALVGMVVFASLQTIDDFIAAPAIVRCDESPAPTLLLVLPGRSLSQILPGSAVRFAIDGFHFAYQDGTIASVSDRIVGPEAMRKVLGPEHGDLLSLAGPLATATVHLPRSGFVVEGRNYAYHSGMQARVWVRLHRQTILSYLFPIVRLLERRRQ